MIMNDVRKERISNMTTQKSKKEMPELYGEKTIRMICDYKYRNLYHYLFSVLIGFCGLVVLSVLFKSFPIPNSAELLLPLFADFCFLFLFSMIGYWLFNPIHYILDKKKIHNWVKSNPEDERVKWMVYKYYSYAFS